MHVRVYKRWNAGLSGIRSVQYRNEKTNDAETSPVPDPTDEVRHYRTEIMNVGMPECRCRR